MYFLFYQLPVFFKDFLKNGGETTSGVSRLSASMLVPLNLRESAALSLRSLHNYLQLQHSNHSDHGEERT